MVDAITYILENNATVQSLVGNREGGDTDNHKVFPVISPQSEKPPYIVVRQVGKIEIAKDCDYEYTIQILSYVTSYDGVKALNQAVIEALKAQSSGNVNGVDFSFVNINNEADDYSLDHISYIKNLTITANGSD